MFQRKPRRFRRHSNSGGFTPRGDGGSQNRSRSNLYSNNQARSKFRNTLSAEKLLEKYNTLAKEAISSGDKISGENYLQHADHFMRIVEIKNKNRDQSKTNISEKSVLNDNRPLENSNIQQEDLTKNKK